MQIVLNVNAQGTIFLLAGLKKLTDKYFDEDILLALTALLDALQKNPNLSTMTAIELNMNARMLMFLISGLKSLDFSQENSDLVLIFNSVFNAIFDFCNEEELDIIRDYKKYVL
jgi:hypothetical protein